MRSPESMNARRIRSPGTSAALAIASTSRPVSAPCRNSPVKSRLTKAVSSVVVRDSRPTSNSLRRADEPLPVVRWISEIAASSSPTVSDGSSAGSTSRPNTAE